jgi:hypothetical protein
MSPTILLRRTASIEGASRCADCGGFWCALCLIATAGVSVDVCVHFRCRWQPGRRCRHICPAAEKLCELFCCTIPGFICAACGPHVCATVHAACAGPRSSKQDWQARRDPHETLTDYQVAWLGRLGFLWKQPDLWWWLVVVMADHFKTTLQG